MKKISILILSSILLVSCKTKTVDEDIINNVFKEFNNARINKNGTKIFELTDNETHTVYDSILKWSLTANKKQLNQISIVNHLNVLMSRIIFGDSLKSYTGKDLMINTFNISTLDDAQKTAFSNVKLSSIVIKDDTASSTIFGNIPTKFVREMGIWKYNYTSFLDLTDKQILNQGVTTEDQILLFLNSPEILKYAKNGYFFLPDIYTPVNERK